MTTPPPALLTAKVLAGTVLTAVVLTATGCSSATHAGTATVTPFRATSNSPSPAPPSTATTSGSVQPERSTPTAPTTVPPALAPVDRSSVDAVATAVVSALNTADTRVDSGPNDAAARTVSLLTADYAAAVITTPPLRSPGAQWNAWTTHGVRLTATVAGLPDDRPADTASRATRLYLVTQTPTPRTGATLAPVVTVAYVALRRVEAGWAVAQVEQR